MVISFENEVVRKLTSHMNAVLVKEEPWKENRVSCTQTEDGPEEAQQPLASQGVSSIEPALCPYLALSLLASRQ